MRIVTYLNITKEEFESRKKNIWFGISLGNKYFSRENLEKYIPYLVEYSKEHLLIVIADAIHAINIEVLDNETPARSWKVAERKGAEKENEIKEIISKLPVNQQEKISVIHWREVEVVNEKAEIYKIVKDEFLNNEKFREYIISIVKDNPKVALKERTINEYEQLSDYILREIPLYINGAYYNGKRYLLQPYPGLGKLDTLIMGLQSGSIFPELSKKLNIIDKVSIMEVYAE